MKRRSNGSQAAPGAPTLPTLPTTPSAQAASAQPTAAVGGALSQTINAMQPISLKEMDRVALMNRIDTKFVLGEAQLLELLDAIGSEYRVLEVNGARLSPYVTLYFDTHDRQCYRQHHNRKLNRRKYRMREYLSSGVSFLEVKSKSNKGRTDKRRISIDEIEETLSTNSTEFIESVAGETPALEPQLWTNFSRVTLVNRHQAERVTLDWELDFHSPGRDASLPRVVIAEVKQETDDRMSPVRKQLRVQGIRPMRISKYCLGSVLLDPTLKQNRFKRKLLAIEKIAAQQAN